MFEINIVNGNFVQMFMHKEQTLEFPMYSPPGVMPYECVGEFNQCNDFK